MNPPLNIWANIFKASQSKFVHPIDKHFIDVFQKIDCNNHNICLKLEHVPEPRVGNIEAPIYILSANPSFPNDTKKNPFRLNNLNNDKLNNIWIKYKNSWWDAHLTLVNQGFGQAMLRNSNVKNISQLQETKLRDILSNNVCSIEYFPYASQKYNHNALRLSSQQYTFDLVKYAMSKNKFIIISRLYKEWLYAIPKLLTYQNLYTLSNHQRLFVTNNTLQKNKISNNHIDMIMKFLNLYQIL